MKKFLCLFTLLGLMIFSGPVDSSAQIDSNSDSETETEYVAPEPTKLGPQPGPFAKGKVRLGFYAGAGSTYNQTYMILGAGLGYYVLNGLEIGADVEG